MRVFLFPGQGSPAHLDGGALRRRFAIAQELSLPVKLIGVGEAVEDLRPFDPDDFARALIAQ